MPFTYRCFVSRGVDIAMPESTRTFRLFVSSTFSDLKAERNALHELVFPRLRTLCQAYGARFQAVDLRWGVSEEASRDQQTLKILHVAVTPDSRRAISASTDETLIVWDLDTGAQQMVLRGAREESLAIAVTPDGRHALSGSNQAIHVWDLQRGTLVSTLTGHRSWVRSIAVALDGRRFVSASSDRTLKVWDLARAIGTLAPRGHTATISAIAVFPDGQRAVSASYDHTLIVWDIENAAPLFTLRGHGGAVGAVAVTPDGRHALSGSADRTVKVWDPQVGSVLETQPGDAPIYVVAVTPDGRHAVSASDELCVWDLASGKLLHSLAASPYHFPALALTPDGERVISASDDMSLAVWDVRSRARSLLVPHQEEDSFVSVIAAAPGATWRSADTRTAR